MFFLLGAFEMPQTREFFWSGVPNWFIQFLIDYEDDGTIRFYIGIRNSQLVLHLSQEKISTFYFSLQKALRTEIRPEIFWGDNGFMNVMSHPKSPKIVRLDIWVDKAHYIIDLSEDKSNELCEMIQPGSSSL